jgi:alkylhydroperoxidase family enzyme
LLFLQAAGSHFSTAHDLVAAVREAIRAPHHEQATDASRTDHAVRPHNGHGPRRPAVDPGQLAERLERAGCESHESLLVALATMATIDSHADVDADWIASVATRIDDSDLLLQTVGVVFAFNTINRIADARRVQLEYRLVREWKPIRSWVERLLASFTGVAYDLSFKHHARHSSTELMDRLRLVFERLGVPEVPDVFRWLSRSPVVLEGVLEMLEANVSHAKVHPELLKVAMAIGVASRAMPGSELRKTVEQWLPPEALGDAKAVRAWAAPPSGGAGADLASACRRYAWQVANAAYTVTDDQIRQLATLGLSDAELLDLTLATSLFSALAIIEPISAAITPAVITTPKTSERDGIGEVQVQLA